LFPSARRVPTAVSRRDRDRAFERFHFAHKSHWSAQRRPCARSLWPDRLLFLLARKLSYVLPRVSRLADRVITFFFYLGRLARPFGKSEVMGHFSANTMKKLGFKPNKF
jgi:hypothetical protein